jgi:hypothetical protein
VDATLLEPGMSRPILVRPIALIMVLASASIASAPAAWGQTPSVLDSVLALNRVGKWDLAGQLAGKSLAAAKSPDEKCALLFNGLYAATRLGKDTTAPRSLKTFDDECAATATAKQYATAIADLRRELELPVMPTTGVDWSGVDEFWRMVDTLTRGIKPSPAQWRALLFTPGYRIAAISSPNIQQQIDLSFNPARRAERDSLLKKSSQDSAAVAHLLDAVAHRAELTRFQATVAPSAPDTIRTAMQNARKFIPAGARTSGDPPLVTFTLFAQDGFSQAPGVVLDLLQVYDNGFTDFLSHEFNHSLSAQLNRTATPPGANDARLYGAIRSLRNEGIADMIDKTYPLRASSPGMQWYADGYNAAYQKTPAALHTLDSLLVAVGKDSTVAADAGTRAQRLLPYASHPNGAYIARTILETFGKDSLMVGVYSPFAYIRAYRAAEVRRGNPDPFSPQAIAVLDAMERRYAKP